MALSANRIADNVQTDLQAKGFKFDVDGVGFSRALLDSMCARVVEEIKLNAQVTGPVTVISVSAVTIGIGVSGPGAGTLTAGVIS